MIDADPKLLTRTNRRPNGASRGGAGTTFSDSMPQLYPVQVQAHGEAQAATGSTAQSSARLARRAAVLHGVGLVRVVVGTTPALNCAYDPGDGTVRCWEAPLPFPAGQFSGGEQVVKALVAKTLEKRLLGPGGQLVPGADIGAAFRAAVIRVEAWMRLGDPLTEDELRAAEKNRRTVVRPWTCARSREGK